MPLSNDTFTEADIAGMLEKIPPRPEYNEWMKILSAVFAVLPYATGAQLLNAWSPEQREGEYFQKHQHRWKQVGIGSLVMLAKQHGWAGTKSKRKGKFLIRQAPTPTRRNTPPSWLQPPPPAPTTTAPTSALQLPTEINMSEAQRIAAELVKMHDDGFIVGPDDPNARIYARAIHLHPEDYGTIY